MDYITGKSASFYLRMDDSSATGTIFWWISTSGSLDGIVKTKDGRLYLFTPKFFIINPPFYINGNDSNPTSFILANGYNVKAL